MNLSTRRTLSPGRIVALSRQGDRWWPHNDSASCANTFRETAATPGTFRLCHVPTLVALPLAAASVATLISAREASTYVLQAPLQATVTAPALSTLAKTTTLVEPIADRDATAIEFSIPFAEPADAPVPVPLPPVPELPPILEQQVVSILGKNTPPVDPPVEQTPEFIDPFQGLELEQELSDTDGPSSGLLPDLDDFMAMEDPEDLSGGEPAIVPFNQSLQSKLAQYQKDFPEIFKVARTDAAKRGRTPVASAKGRTNRKKALEAVAHAKQWREKSGHAKNERRRHGFLGKLKQLFKARS